MGRKGKREKGESTHHAIRNSQFASLLTITLLAVSPSFVFWSRQGVFVTNLTQPLCLWAIWQGLRWLRTGRQSALIQAAFASGLAIYAKLLAIWVVVPFWGLVFVWWMMGRWGDGEMVRVGKFFY
ncbi:glycosyltransferase family 39 protein [Microcoleus sp. OTE_8_concoct_300]|uniref:glycosyltransferase family 39 protein n=1 Tax=Microcoleus sp. OTE_8_concoct_300 TaxID=2964710 RepID=UPI00403EFB2E